MDMKLVEILASSWKEWPCSDKSFVYTTESGMVWDSEGETHGQYFYSGEFEYERVTRAEWEAERARLTSGQVQPLEDSEEFDQVLWDKVAIKSMIAYMSQPNAIGDVPIEEFVGWGTGIADAFMVERAKRLKQ